MIQRFGIYSRTGLILIGLALVILAVLLVTNRGDLTSATMLLVAFSCFLTGLFIFLLEGENEGNQKFAADFMVPYTSTFSRILADLGVVGHAHFVTIPDDRTFPAPIMQFNPVIDAIPKWIGENWTFYTRKDSPGLLTVPSGNILLKKMEDEKAITLPSSEPDLFKAINEVYQDILEITDDVLVTRSDNEIVVELKNFRLIEGCIKIRNESPQNCLTAPCPICSLIGIIIAKGLGQTSVMKDIEIEKDTGRVEIHVGLYGSP